MMGPMKKLLIIQHEDHTPAGTTLDWAAARGLETQTWFPAREASPPAPGPWIGIVVCGGSMDVFQEAKYPWLKAEKEFLRGEIAAQTKIFGLCLGSQLLAELLGAKISVHDGWEVGFTPVKSPQGESVPAFQFHHCVFEIPPGAARTLTGDYWANQAFRVGDQLIATQFHPESTEAWIRECATEIEAHHVGNVQTPAQILASLPLQKDLQRWYFAQLDGLFLR
jgi:GMP synthase (glutamine-hydrolysing)